MTWAVPAALAGFALLALPVLIHLMGAGRATVRRFPSLRFIPGTRLPPVRRRRLHDVPLMLLRMLAIAAATLAVARPLTSGVTRRTGTFTTRAIVADTGSPNAVVRDAVRRAADSARGGAGVAAVVATRDPAAVISGAVAWLGGQPGRRELVVVSDFRLDGIDAADLAMVPAYEGIRLVRPAEAKGDTAISLSGRADGRRVTVRASVTPGRTDAIWTAGPRTPRALPLSLALGAGGADSVSIVPRGSMPIGAADSLAPPRTPQVGDLVAALYMDQSLRRAADGFRAGMTRVVAHDRLTIVSPGAPASVATAALAVAAERELARGSEITVRDPGLQPDSVLETWQRAAGAEAPAQRAEDGVALARSLWAMALLALAAEFALRRRLGRGMHAGATGNAGR